MTQSFDVTLFGNSIDIELFDPNTLAAKGFAETASDEADRAEAAADQAQAIADAFGTAATLTADDDPARVANSGARVSTQDADFRADLRMRGYADNVAARAFQGQRASVFADVARGSNANAGTSLALAKAGLSNATALMTGTAAVALAENSFWRDKALLAAGQAVYSVGGDGSVPTISGADLIAGTAQGSANVWQKSISFDAPDEVNTTDRLRVFKNGVLLTRVGSIATCSSTPNSFVDAKRSDGSPVTMYINVGAGANPSSFNIEVTVRAYAIYSPGAATVHGPLVIEKTMANNGGLSVRGEADIKRVLLLDGSKHNGLIGSGTVSGSIASRCDPPTSYEISNGLWTAYMNDPTGKSYRFERCGASELSPAPVAGFSANLAIYGHGGAAGLDYARGDVIQCWGLGDVIGGHGTGADVCIETGCYWNCRQLVANQAFPVTMEYSLAQIAAQVKGTATGESPLAGFTAENFAWYFQERTTRSNNTPPLAHRGGDTNLSNGVIWCGEGFNFNGHAMNAVNGVGGSQTINNMVIGGWSGWVLAVVTGVDYTGDFNVFGSGNTFVETRHFFAHYHGTDYETLAGWQAATGEDANSVYIKRADQVAGSADAFWLAWAEAATGTNLDTIGPVVGDFRINPTAKVYKADNTALTGTFADGTTPITEAAQQMHWDWNLRAAVAGPTRRWPRVPRTDAQELEFIKAPDGWTF